MKLFSVKFFKIIRTSPSIPGKMFTQLVIFSLILPNAAFSAWTPITGIPEPSFGVNDVAPAAPSPWTTEVSGFYYICPDCSGATDNANTYGYPTKPRMTIPSVVPAGSVVEMRGNHITENTNKQITTQGTIANPVYIRGALDTIPTLSFRLTLLLGSSYTILEHLKFIPNHTVAYPNSGLTIVEGDNNIVVRNSEFSGVGDLERRGGISVGSWGYSGATEVSNIVLNALNIHDLGDVNSSIDQDAHGVTVNGSVKNLWLVNSEMARCSGDGIQIEAQTGRMSKIHHIYVGNNISHNHKQSGTWVKHATDVIFSGNEVYGHALSNSSAGCGMGFQCDPERVWFLNNKIHNNSMGIFIASACDSATDHGAETFIVGNLLYDNYNPIDPDNPYNSGAISIRGSLNRYIVNNTISGYDAGLNGISSSGKYIIINNIFSRKKIATSYDVALYSLISNESDLINNLFSGSNSFNVKWDGVNYSSLEQLFASRGEGSGNIIGEPVFVNSNIQNFHLQSNSPAKDSGVSSEVYAKFQAQYGINISKDIDGVARPNGLRWDLGAYEFSNTMTGLTSPVNFIIKVK